MTNSSDPHRRRWSNRLATVALSRADGRCCWGCYHSTRWCSVVSTGRFRPAYSHSTILSRAEAYTLETHSWRIPCQVVSCTSFHIVFFLSFLFAITVSRMTTDNLIQPVTIRLSTGEGSIQSGAYNEAEHLLSLRWNRIVSSLRHDRFLNFRKF